MVMRVKNGGFRVGTVTHAFTYMFMQCHFVSSVTLSMREPESPERLSQDGSRWGVYSKGFSSLI